MQDYIVRLESEVFKSFLCQKAANSLDIDIEKKSIHTLQVSADLKTDYNVGLIVGASGSGKTTLCHTMFGDDCFLELLDLSKPVIEQFPSNHTYDDISRALNGIGLSSVPCWLRPAYTLSNGQRARAEAALQLVYLKSDKTSVLDEFTSVVDRTVAKAMSHCLQKYARKNNKRIVVAACHYDVIEWLNPDFIIDCNKQSYIDRRSMVGSFNRTDRLYFTIKPVDRKTWPVFSKYHYLSKHLPGGVIYCYGLFHGQDQIGFQCFAPYIIGDLNTYFSNRTVIQPDYCGLGLGVKLINATSKIMSDKGFRVKAKFSSTPIYKSLSKDLNWRLTKISKNIKKERIGKGITRRDIKEKSKRSKCTAYHFDYVAT